jgi:hypothetical protein
VSILMSDEPDHFRMLRLAIYRRLQCDQLSETKFSVSSSREDEGHPPYTVDVHKGCPCDSTLPCSHLAIAVDRWHEREASLEARADYFSARRLDFLSLHVRPGLCGDDRRFMRRCVERVAAQFTSETPAKDYAPTF